MSKVTITTAINLSPAQLKKLTTAIQEKYGKDSKIETVVDPSILGGVVVTVGSHQFDNSYRSKVETIKHQLTTALAE